MSLGKSRVSPVVFFKQVRQEMGRVAWPDRKEVVMTSVLVFVMVFIFSVFFLGADYFLSSIIRWVLGWQTL